MRKTVAFIQEKIKDAEAAVRFRDSVVALEAMNPNRSGAKRKALRSALRIAERTRQELEMYKAVLRELKSPY